MKHLIVSERVCGEERPIQDVSFNKLIMVTDEFVGLVGIDGQRDLMHLLDAMLENIAIQMTGFDEEHKDHQDVLDAVIMQGILAINLATLAIGPASGYKELEKESVKLFDITSKLMGIGRDLANLSPNTIVMTEDELREALGKQLMNELEESEKRDQKEEG